MMKCQNCSRVVIETADAAETCPQCGATLGIGGDESIMADPYDGLIAPIAEILPEAPRDLAELPSRQRPKGALRDVVIAASILAGGCFMPLLGFSFMAERGALLFAYSDAYILIALAVLAIAMTHARIMQAVTWIGATASFIVVMDFVMMLSDLRRAAIKAEAGANSVAATQSGMLELYLGWLPLFVGAFGLLFVGLKYARRQKRARQDLTSL